MSKNTIVKILGATFFVIALAFTVPMPTRASAWNFCISPAGALSGVESPVDCAEGSTFLDVQSLVQNTNTLQTENAELKSELATLKADVATLKAMLSF